MYKSIDKYIFVDTIVLVWSICLIDNYLNLHAEIQFVLFLQDTGSSKRSDVM